VTDAFATLVIRVQRIELLIRQAPAKLQTGFSVFRETGTGAHLSPFSAFTVLKIHPSLTFIPHRGHGAGFFRSCQYG